MMIPNKPELAVAVLGALTSTMVADAVSKIIITSFAMIVGTTGAYFWRKFLIRFDREGRLNKFFQRLKLKK